VRVHIPGESDDRYMDPLAAKVLSNHYVSVWQPELKAPPKQPKPASERLLTVVEPPRKNRKYRFELLRVGESFLVPSPPDRLIKVMNSLSSCRNWQQRKSRRIGRPKRFALRMTTCGVRVWRTA